MKLPSILTTFVSDAWGKGPPLCAQPRRAGWELLEVRAGGKHVVGSRQREAPGCAELSSICPPKPGDLLWSGRTGTQGRVGGTRMLHFAVRKVKAFLEL